MSNESPTTNKHDDVKGRLVEKLFMEIFYNAEKPYRVNCKGLRKKAKEAIEQVIDTAYGCGYAEGHEDQMKMRIMDAQEARNAKA